MPQKDDIKTMLERIEKKIDQSKQSSIRQWVASFGFGLMIASISLLKQDAILAVAMFIAGLIFVLLSTYVKKA